MRKPTFMIVVTLGLAVSPVTAFAYFDPGTGSLLIQGLIGAIAAVTLFWSNLKARVRSFFSKDKSGPPPIDEKPD